MFQFVSHEALDQSREGFINALAEEGFVDGENIELELANAQSDHSSLASISSELSSDSDLIPGHRHFHSPAGGPGNQHHSDHWCSHH